MSYIPATAQRVRIATVTPDAMTAADVIVGTNLAGAPGPFAVTLPAAPGVGRRVVVKDVLGNAAAQNVTITPAAGNVDGAANVVLVANFASSELVYNGTEWNVI